MQPIDIIVGGLIAALVIVIMVQSFRRSKQGGCGCSGCSGCSSKENCKSG